jgi:ribosomal protein S9
MTDKYQTVTVKLTGNDGNAFAIMGAVSKALKKAGATAEEVEEYMNESMSGDYNNLLRTAMRWVNVE